MRNTSYCKIRYKRSVLHFFVGSKLIAISNTHLQLDNAKGLDSPRWYAINTKLREEDRVDQNLTAWGVETFAPRIKTSRHTQYRDHPIYLSRSFFPRYIFARFDVSKMLHKVYYTRGVKSVVSFNGRPLQVESEIIAVLQTQVGKDGFVRLVDQLKHGDEVTVNGGLFKGISGMFDRATNDTGRVEILLTAINYQAVIVVEKEMVQRASQLFL
ncbi:MAG: transcription termination/antitermination NusG family protein [Pyrinomonadaceae bacterium]